MRRTSLRWIARATVAALVAALAHALPAPAHAVSATVSVHTFITIPPNSSGELAATCPAGKTAVGGGYGRAPSPTAIIDVSRPDGSGWRVHAWNPSSSKMQIMAIATCATASGRVVTSASASVPRLGDVPVTAACPSGRRLTGGGYALGTANGLATPYPNLQPVQNRPGSPGQGWTVRGFNAGATTQTIHTYAVCVTIASTQVVTKSETIQAESETIGWVPCPENTVVTGGGWAYGAAGYRLDSYSSSPPVRDPAFWDVQYTNESSITFGVTTYGICVPKV